MNLYKKTASELAEMIKNKEITSQEVTKNFLDRIKAVEDKVGAFSNIFEEKALEQARKIDREIMKKEEKIMKIQDFLECLWR